MPPIAHQPGGDLVVRRSRERDVYFLLTMVVLAADALFSAHGDHGRWADVQRGASVVFLAVASVVAREVIRSGPSSPPLLRIGPVGLTVPGAELVPWTDIASVRVTRVRSGTIRAVAFLPRTGRAVPAVRPLGLRTLPGGGQPGRAAARYGSALVVLPGRMTVTATQAVDAAQVFGHLEVTWAPSTRGRPHPAA